MVDAASTITVYFANEIDTCVFLPHIPTYIKSAGFCAGRSLSSQGQSSSMLEATTAGVS